MQMDTDFIIQLYYNVLLLQLQFLLSAAPQAET